MRLVNILTNIQKTYNKDIYKYGNDKFPTNQYLIYKAYLPEVKAFLSSFCYYPIKSKFFSQRCNSKKLFKKITSSGYQGFIKAKITYLKPVLHPYFLLINDNNGNLKAPSVGESWTAWFPSNELLYVLTLDYYKMQPISGYFAQEAAYPLRKITKLIFTRYREAKSVYLKNYYENLLSTLLINLHTINENDTTFKHISIFIEAFLHLTLHTRINKINLTKNNNIIFADVSTLVTKEQINEEYLLETRRRYIERLGKFTKISK
jgi:hypothetical protein